MHFCDTVLLTLLILPRFQVGRKESQRSFSPKNLDLQQRLSKNRETMIMSTNHWETTEPSDMVLVNVVGLTEGQTHSQLLGKGFCVGTAPGLQKGDDIRLLLLDDMTNERETIFAAGKNIIAEDA